MIVWLEMRWNETFMRILVRYIHSKITHCADASTPTSRNRYFPHILFFRCTTEHTCWSWKKLIQGEKVFLYFCILYMTCVLKPLIKKISFSYFYFRVHRTHYCKNNSKSIDLSFSAYCRYFKKFDSKQEKAPWSIKATVTTCGEVNKKCNSFTVF